MAEKDESTAVRLTRYIALGVPMLSRVLAVAFAIAAMALAFLQFGDYDPGTRADLSLTFAVLALVALGAGYVVPWLVRTLLPPRR